MTKRRKNTLKKILIPLLICALFAATFFTLYHFDLFSKNKDDVDIKPPSIVINENELSKSINLEGKINYLHFLKIFIEEYRKNISEFSLNEFEILFTLVDEEITLKTILNNEFVELFNYYVL